MSNSKPFFILAGNGSNYNRGCEAMHLGTLKILRHHFTSPQFLVVNSYLDNQQFEQQLSRETDPAIIHRKMHRAYKRFDFYWFLYNVLKRFSPKTIKYIIYKDIVPNLARTAAVLALGGDNYSLDSGAPPTHCTDLDDLVINKGKPMVIWGASVGPFSALPEYEEYMKRHLRQVHIMAREPETVNYLASIGVTENVHRVADPAFLMDSSKPSVDFYVEPGAIGLNLSPLMARFVKVAQSNIEKWKAVSAEIVQAIIEKTHRKVYLIPHVMGKQNNNDYLFLKDVISLLSEKKCDVTLVDSNFNAAELKWILSQLDLFAGGRMHATIASLSSFVPTLSLAYSMKAKGLNQDVFGHMNYCISPEELEPGLVVEKITDLLNNSENVKSHLKQRIPEIQQMALNAGKILKEIISIE